MRVRSPERLFNLYLMERALRHRSEMNGTFATADLRKQDRADVTQLFWAVARCDVTSTKDIRRGQWQLRGWQEIPDPQTGPTDCWPGPADGGNFIRQCQLFRAIGRSENRAAEGLRRDDATMRRQRPR